MRGKDPDWSLIGLTVLFVTVAALVVAATSGMLTGTDEAEPATAFGTTFVTVDPVETEQPPADPNIPTTSVAVDPVDTGQQSRQTETRGLSSLSPVEHQRIIWEWLVANNHVTVDTDTKAVVIQLGDTFDPPFGLATVQLVDYVLTQIPALVEHPWVRTEHPDMCGLFFRESDTTFMLPCDLSHEPVALPGTAVTGYNQPQRRDSFANPSNPLSPLNPLSPYRLYD